MGPNARYAIKAHLSSLLALFSPSACDENDRHISVISVSETNRHLDFQARSLGYRIEICFSDPALTSTLLSETRVLLMT